MGVDASSFPAGGCAQVVKGFCAKSDGKDKLTALIQVWPWLLTRWRALAGLLGLGPRPDCVGDECRTLPPPIVLQYACMFLSAGEPGNLKKVQASVTAARKVFRVMRVRCAGPGSHLHGAGVAAAYGARSPCSALSALCPAHTLARPPTHPALPPPWPRLLPAAPGGADAVAGGPAVQGRAALAARGAGQAQDRAHGHLLWRRPPGLGLPGGRGWRGARGGGGWLLLRRRPCDAGPTHPWLCTTAVLLSPSTPPSPDAACTDWADQQQGGGRARAEGVAVFLGAGQRVHGARGGGGHWAPGGPARG